MKKRIIKNAFLILVLFLFDSSISRAALFDKNLHLLGNQVSKNTEIVPYPPVAQTSSTEEVDPGAQTESQGEGGSADNSEQSSSGSQGNTQGDTRTQPDPQGQSGSSDRTGDRPSTQSSQPEQQSGTSGQQEQSGTSSDQSGQQSSAQSTQSSSQSQEAPAYDVTGGLWSLVCKNYTGGNFDYSFYIEILKVEAGLRSKIVRKGGILNNDDVPTFVSGKNIKFTYFIEKTELYFEGTLVDEKNAKGNFNAYIDSQFKGSFTFEMKRVESLTPGSEIKGKWEIVTSEGKSKLELEIENSDVKGKMTTGDKTFDVKGTYYNNELVFYKKIDNSFEIFVTSTTDNGKTFTGVVITKDEKSIELKIVKEEPPAVIAAGTGQTGQQGQAGQTGQQGQTGQTGQQGQAGQQGQTGQTGQQGQAGQQQTTTQQVIQPPIQETSIIPLVIKGWAPTEKCSWGGWLILEHGRGTLWWLDNKGFAHPVSSKAVLAKYNEDPIKINYAPRRIGYIDNYKIGIVVNETNSPESVKGMIWVEQNVTFYLNRGKVINEDSTPGLWYIIDQKAYKIDGNDVFLKFWKTFNIIERVNYGYLNNYNIGSNIVISSKVISVERQNPASREPYDVYYFDRSPEDD